jgi:WD repeat-containing protein 35
MVASWNAQYRKLTTSDSKGLIIVWLLHKGTWFEEMINNRNKSVVRDMKWRANGSEICIVYEDGTVIVGGVDGNRLWSREVAAKLTLLEWSPDGRAILFGTADGQVLVHNHHGVRVGAVPLPAVADAPGARLIGLEWYDGAEGYALPDLPCLAVAFENGRVQIMRGEEDPKPILIDSGLTLTQVKWNSNGTVLALAGAKVAGGPGGPKETSEVQFYTPFGRYITSLKVPGGSAAAVTWEGGGLRLAVRCASFPGCAAGVLGALSRSFSSLPFRFPSCPFSSVIPRCSCSQLAVDSYIYFANIRPDYKWAAFGETVVYAYTKPDRSEQCVVFWNIKTDER